jgi:hypothetical protein
MSDVILTGISADSELMFFDQDGESDKASYSFFRTGRARFHPTDRSMSSPRALRYLFEGITPAEPLLDANTSIVAFGSCFASHIANYLHAIGYNVANKRHRAAYVASMGEGVVNTFAIRQQFEWAWEAREPAVQLWHGYDARALGYDDAVRLDTKDMFDRAEAFIITLGLSEVWYDEPTGEVFWKAVPKEYFDPSRHKFRIASYAENLENLRAIRRLIRTYRPDAPMIFTLSPIPLKATFRATPCISANAVSKAILRAALDEFLRGESADTRLYYFPSFEVVLNAFEHPFMEDRRHPHKHVLDFNMAAFERFYCRTGMTDAQLLDRFRAAQGFDAEVVRAGHWAVPRTNLLFHKPPSGEP